MRIPLNFVNRLFFSSLIKANETLETRFSPADRFARARRMFSFSRSFTRSLVCRGVLRSNTNTLIERKREPNAFSRQGYFFASQSSERETRERNRAREEQLRRHINKDGEKREIHRHSSLSRSTHTHTHTLERSRLEID